MTLDVSDRAWAREIEQLIESYRQASDVPAKPLRDALREKLELQSELVHEVVVGHLREVLGYDAQTVAWILRFPLRVVFARQLYDRLIGAERLLLRAAEVEAAALPDARPDFSHDRGFDWWLAAYDEPGAWQLRLMWITARMPPTRR
jgi:hypothetical protein